MSLFGQSLKYILSGMFAPILGPALVAYDDPMTGSRRDDNDKWYTKIVKGLNNLLNYNHDWFNYDEWNSTGDSIHNQITKESLTGAEKEANAFSSEEAQKSRDFELYMARNKYSLETQSMQDAGVNPAMVYGGGSLVPTAANGASASSVSPSGAQGIGLLMDVLPTLMRLPQELKNLKSEGGLIRAQEEKAIKEGNAALMNAGANVQNANTNERNAGTNERNATTNERLAAVQEAEVKIKQLLADNNTKATDAEVRKWAADEAYTREMINWIPEDFRIRNEQASAAQRSATASVMAAKAALKNADTNAKIGESQVLLNNVVRQKEAIYRDYLPAQLSAQVDEMKARGYYFNQQGQLCDKEGHLVDAQTARQYVGLACDVAKTACQVAGTVMTGGVGGVAVDGTSAPAASIPSYDAYSGVLGTYGD